MDNFERFWETWPKSFRKGGKSACRVKWKKFYCDTCADQVIKHIEWMKTTDAWRKDDGAFYSCTFGLSEPTTLGWG